jgi:hypothetical protein
MEVRGGWDGLWEDAVAVGEVWCFPRLEGRLLLLRLRLLTVAVLLLLSQWRCSLSLLGWLIIDITTLARPAHRLLSRVVAPQAFSATS